MDIDDHKISDQGIINIITRHHAYDVDGAL